MHEPHLEITFRRGVALAAYYHLVDGAAVTSCRCETVEPGLVVDYDETGRALGIEITAPRRVTLPDLNALLERLGHRPMDEREFAPLRAA